MRHRKKGAKLSRTADHRKSLLRNLATSLALHGHVKTTTPKAKALVSFYEQLITHAKGAEPMNAIREIKRHLFTEPAQKAFMAQLPKVTAQSGYLRTTKVGLRPGDMAEMSLVEFV
ncbi:MAG: 50S ribosomal protein L17 [Candidatus Gracilibacteria bacterium]|nr:50S ribosomal protein L17 [bacterium]MDZ4216911.1 50S ribosomal protein L17 [Candidatus Gracilibacteria bacterium]